MFLSAYSVSDHFVSSSHKLNKGNLLKMKRRDLYDFCHVLIRPVKWDDAARNAKFHCIDINTDYAWVIVTRNHYNDAREELMSKLEY